MARVSPGQAARDRSEWSARLAQAIREARLSRGVSQQAMAAAMGTGLRVYQRIEYGERVPDVSQLHKIALALGMSGADLMRRADDGEPL